MMLFSVICVLPFPEYIKIRDPFLALLTLGNHTEKNVEMLSLINKISIKCLQLSFPTNVI